MGHVALEIPARLFAFGGAAQGHHAANTGIQALGDALDYASLAGGVAAFEDHHDLQLLVLDPLLQLDQFDLQPGQLFLIDLVLDLADFGLDVAVMVKFDRSTPCEWPLPFSNASSALVFFFFFFFFSFLRSPPVRSPYASPRRKWYRQSQVNGSEPDGIQRGRALGPRCKLHAHLLASLQSSHCCLKCGVFITPDFARVRPRLVCSNGLPAVEAIDAGNSNRGRFPFPRQRSVGTGETYGIHK